MTFARRTLPFVLFSLLIMAAVAMPKVQAAPVVNGEQGVDLVCKTKAMASEIAEVTAKTRSYIDGAGIALENRGECAILPAPFPAMVESTKAVGKPFKDPEGDFVQIHLISFHVNGAEYWGVVIEILKKAGTDV